MKITKEHTGNNGANPMWGGAFARGQDATMRAINVSIHVDKRLYREDIAGSVAHATMLGEQGIISAGDAAAIVQGLRQIQQEITEGRFTFTEALEDIHMHVEARLKELVGEAAGRLHTARSRNDQVATAFRLFLRNGCDEIIAALHALRQALLDRAEEHAAHIMPGFTHLQAAQPVTLGHHLMAYAEMAARDTGRFGDARARLNESPLGACALAGTSFPIDRHQTAELLGFVRPAHNSLDAVGSRDFALEYLSAASIAAVHLSRLAEEIILWTSPAFGFARLSDAFSTGSSIMPQKRNPDAAELVRGKAGRITGALTGLTQTMKGLPLAYNKDLQEDKEPVFAAHDALMLCISAMTGMIRDIVFHTDAMHAMAGSGHATATDLADWLVQRLNLPFREAHHITGKIVRRADELAVTLEQMPLAEMQAVHPGITQEVMRVLSVEHSVNSRSSFGGTAPARVREAVEAARTHLAAEEKALREPEE